VVLIRSQCVRIRAAIVRRNIGADNAGNANGLSHFCADAGGAPPSKSSAIITTLAQRVEDLARGPDRIAV